jgi:hypothetical protein
MLPSFRSSAQDFMVSMGITRIKAAGNTLKYGRRMAIFMVKKL